MKSHGYSIRLFGAFALNDIDGTDVTPKQAKHSAIIAILALTPHYRMTRPKMQALLWSESSQPRSNANLRQALYLIRSKHPTLIDCDNQFLWLNPDAFSVDWENSKNNLNQVLLDGIDINEDGFEEWLREKRSTDHNELHLNRKPLIHASLNELKVPVFEFEDKNTTQSGDDCDQIVELAKHELIKVALMLQSKVMFSSSQSNLTIEEEVKTKKVLVKFNQFGNQGILNLFLCNHLGAVTWAKTLEMKSIQYDKLITDITKLGHLFFSYIVESSESKFPFIQNDEIEIDNHISYLLKGVLLPNSIPIKKLRFVANSLANYTLSGLGHALLGMVEVFEFGETLAKLNSSTEKIQYHFRKALELDPSSHLVLAFCGHYRSFYEKDVQSGLTYTQKAKELATNCPVSLLFHSTSLGYADKWDEALVSIQKALQISRNLVFSTLIESACSQIALMKGDYETSIKYGEVSFARLPSFRPTVLNLSSAYALNGNQKRASDILSRFIVQNPNFDLDRLNSPDTPFVNDSYKRRILKGVSNINALE